MNECECGEGKTCVNLAAAVTLPIVAVVIIVAIIFGNYVMRKGQSKSVK